MASKMLKKEDFLSFRKEVAECISSELLPFVDQWEQSGYPVRSILRILGKHGLLHKSFSIEFGGEGLSLWHNVILQEELSKIPAGSIGMLVATHLDIVSSMLARYGSTKIVTSWIPKAIKGEVVLSLALSERNAGSDLTSIDTHYIKDGDKYVLSGEKWFITNALHADGFCVLAREKHSSEQQETFTLFFVPAKTKGVTVSSKIDTMGNVSDTASIEFLKVQLSLENILGREGQGFLIQMQQFQYERAIIAVRTYSLCEYYLQKTIDFCNERKTFGKTLIQNQYVQFKLANLTSETKKLKCLTHHCIYLIDSKKDATYLAAMAKFYGGRLVRRLSNTCLQLHGGEGYCSGHYAERFFRDARALSLAGGADEMMLELIFKATKV